MLFSETTLILQKRLHKLVQCIEDEDAPFKNFAHIAEQRNLPVVLCFSPVPFLAKSTATPFFHRLGNSPSWRPFLNKLAIDLARAGVSLRSSFGILSMPLDLATSKFFVSLTTIFSLNACSLIDCSGSGPSSCLYLVDLMYTDSKNALNKSTFPLGV